MRVDDFKKMRGREALKIRGWIERSGACPNYVGKLVINCDKVGAVLMYLVLALPLCVHHHVADTTIVSAIHWDCFQLQQGRNQKR